MNEIYERIVNLIERGDEAMLITVVDKRGSTPASPGAKMLLHADGSTVGTVGGGGLERLATSKAVELLAQRRSLLVTYSLAEDGHVSDAEPISMACGGTISLFYDYLGYQAHIYIFGAGHVGGALAYHLKGSRCRVTLVDPRQDMMTDVDGVTRLVVGEYATALRDEEVREGAFHVIATPSHVFDYDVLHRIFASDWRPRYVGMLGSRSKAASTLQRLVDELGNQVNLDPVYCPVGLDLGGGSPEEIAIAIMAEIQALQYGKTGGQHMRISADDLQS